MDMPCSLHTSPYTGRYSFVIESESAVKKLMLCLSLCLITLGAQAGVINPDCTPEKAVKGAAMKATVGVGGRCSAAETAKDSVGLDDKKGALNDAKGSVGDAKGKVENAVDDPAKAATKALIK